MFAPRTAVRSITSMNSSSYSSKTELLPSEDDEVILLLPFSRKNCLQQLEDYERAWRQDLHAALGSVKAEQDKDAGDNAWGNHRHSDETRDDHHGNCGHRRYDGDKDSLYDGCGCGDGAIFHGGRGGHYRHGICGVFILLQDRHNCCSSNLGGRG